MTVFSDARKVVEQHNGLDLSDALQLLCVRDGYYSPLVGESATMLVTGDGRLAEIGRKLGLRAWDCCQEPMPSN